MSTEENQMENGWKSLPFALWGKLLTDSCRRAPCMLPACAVLGACLGTCGVFLVFVPLLLASVLRLWRILLACIICTVFIFLRMDMHEDASRTVLSGLTEDGMVTLQGTVVQQLAHGGIVDTGWTGTRVAVYGDAPLRCGDVVEVTGQLRTDRGPMVPGMFDPAQWKRGLGVCASVELLGCRTLERPLSWASLRGSAREVRKDLERVLMPEGAEDDPRRQVLCALVLGDKEGADPATMLDFRKGGCMHAFAVSGLHVGLVAGILLLVMRLAHVPPRVAWCVLIAGVAVYVWITGMAVPAMRAYLMLVLVLVGRLLRRPARLLNIWCFAGLFLLMIGPWQVFQSGFQLSFVVYGAIGVGVRLCMRDTPWFGPDLYVPYRVLTDADMRWRTAEICVRGAVMVSFCAWLGSLPLTYGSFHAFNTYGVFTNIAITPILPFVMAAGLLCLCCSGIPYLCWVADALAVKASGVLIAVVSFFGSLPGSYVPACETRAPQEAFVLQLHFGNSVCLLGNPGLLIDCGNKADASFTVQPLLFHSGYTPAALLETRPLASRTGGEPFMLASWPDMQVLQVPPGTSRTLTTEAGTFHIYGAPADIPPSPAENVCPVVTWRNGDKLVVYVGDAPLTTLESVPEDLSGAAYVILGYNKGQMVDAADITERMPKACVILLPSATDAGVDADFAPFQVLTTSEDEPLLQLNAPYSPGSPK